MVGHNNVPVDKEVIGVGPCLATESVNGTGGEERVARPRAGGDEMDGGFIMASDGWKMRQELAASPASVVHASLLRGCIQRERGKRYCTDAAGEGWGILIKKRGFGRRLFSFRG